MAPNPRRPIYRAITEALGRHMTGAERVDLDRYLDKVFPEIPRR